MGVFSWIVCLVLMVYMVAIFVRVILSWFPLNPNGGWATIAGFLYVVTDFTLAPLRQNVPPVRLGNAALDLSPMIVIFVILIIRGVIC